MSTTFPVQLLMPLAYLAHLISWAVGILSYVFLKLLHMSINCLCLQILIPDTNLFSFKFPLFSFWVIGLWSMVSLVWATNKDTLLAHKGTLNHGLIAQPYRHWAWQLCTFSSCSHIMKNFKFNLLLFYHNHKLAFPISNYTNFFFNLPVLQFESKQPYFLMST